MTSMMVGTLEIAKVLMTLFVMLYAYFFLKNTEDYEEKKPWQYLYIAAMFLFTVEVISTLQMFKGGLFHDSWFVDLREFMEFGFLSFFLFSFIYQHYLLLQKGDLIIKNKASNASKIKIWDALVKKYLEIEKKYLGMMKEEDEGPSPEEELKEELEELDEDEELKKEEKELDNIVK